MLHWKSTSLPRPATDHYDLMVAGSSVRTPEGGSAATVRLSVPRRCLGEPRWVQVASALTYAWPHGGDGDFYVDGIPGSGDPTRGRQPWSARVWHPGG